MTVGTHLDSRGKILRSHLSSVVNVRKKTVVVNGAPVDFLERGEGTPVLMIHGFGCNKATWRGVLSRFPSNRYRLIALDVPGLCLARIGSEQRYSNQFYVDWIDGFLNEIGADQCHLLGHSLGTIQAVNYAAVRQHRLKSLILLNVPDIFGPDCSDKLDEFFKVAHVETSEEWYELLCRGFYRLPDFPKVLREFNFNYYHPRLKFAAGLFEMYKAVCPRFITNIQRLECECFVVSSEYDEFSSPKFNMDFRYYFSKVRQLHIDKCGHMSFLENQTQLVENLRVFLDDVERKATNLSRHNMNDEKQKSAANS